MSRSLSYLSRGLLGIAFVGSVGCDATLAITEPQTASAAQKPSPPSADRTPDKSYPEPELGFGEGLWVVTEIEGGMLVAQEYDTYNGPGGENVWVVREDSNGDQSWTPYDDYVGGN